MQGGEEMVAKRFRRNDEEECSSIAAERLGVSETTVKDGDVSVAERALISRGHCLDEGFWEAVVGVARKGGVDVFQDWVRLVTGVPSRGRREAWFQGESDNILTGCADGVQCGTKMAVD